MVDEPLDETELAFLFFPACISSQEKPRQQNCMTISPGANLIAGQEVCNGEGSGTTHHIAGGHHVLILTMVTFGRYRNASHSGVPGKLASVNTSGWYSIFLLTHPEKTAIRV